MTSSRNFRLIRSISIYFLCFSVATLEAIAADSKATIPQSASVVVPSTADTQEDQILSFAVQVKLLASNPQFRESIEFESMTNADFPVSMYNANVVGKAVIGFDVEIDGTISNPKIVKATHPEYGISSLEAVRHWKLKPVKWAFTPRVLQVTAIFEFSITKD